MGFSFREFFNMHIANVKAKESGCSSCSGCKSGTCGGEEQQNTKIVPAAISHYIDSYDIMFLDLVLRAEPEYPIIESYHKFSQYLAFTMQDAMDFYNTVNDQDELKNGKPGLSLGAALYVCYELDREVNPSMLIPWDFKSDAFKNAFDTIAIILRNIMKTCDGRNSEEVMYELKTDGNWQYLDGYDEELKVLLSESRYTFFNTNNILLGGN